MSHLSEFRPLRLSKPMAVVGKSRDPYLGPDRITADPGMLDVVGFVTATSQLIADFARGSL